MARARMVALWSTLVGMGLATEVLEPSRGTVRCTQCGHAIEHKRSRAGSTMKARAQMFGHLINQHQAAYATALDTLANFNAGAGR